MAITGGWSGWDPFEALDRLRREMGRSYGQGVRRPAGAPLRVTEDPEGLTIAVEVPGVEPDEVELTATADMVTLKGERRAEDLPEGIRPHRRERWSGAFTRSLSVPSGYDAQAISATCRNGLLTLRLPRREVAKPKQIEVRKR
jgi:HSP20 family protein